MEFSDEMSTTTEVTAVSMSRTLMEMPLVPAADNPLAFSPLTRRPPQLQFTTISSHRRPPAPGLRKQNPFISVNKLLFWGLVADSLGQEVSRHGRDAADRT